MGTETTSEAVTDATIRAVKEKFPNAELRLLTAAADGEQTSFIFKAPTRAEYKRFRALYIDPGQRPNALEALVFGCVVWPQTEAVTAALERRPALTEIFGNRLVGWAGSEQEVTEKIVDALHRSRADLRETGEAVTAYLRLVLRDEEGPLAEAGELVIADAIDCLRSVRKFLRGQ